MSSDEAFLEQLLRALREAGLEAIVVGSVAAVLQGAPIMTQDVDLLIRDTRRNRDKLARFCSELGECQLVQPSPTSRTLSTVGTAVQVDLLFDELPSTHARFESLRSRSVRVPIGQQVAVVASLEDVIESKAAADRDKDRAQLPVLRNTLRVKRKLEEDASASAAASSEPEP
jgi:predicted nucleotidyltransferase